VSRRTEGSPLAAHAPPTRDGHDLVAVIDVGSNSGRIVVLRATPDAYLEVVADGRAPLRLARDLAGDSGLSEDAIERTARVLRDFRALADGAGATRLVAVATSAVREAPNADDLLVRVREAAGVEVTVIDGDAEARFAFAGAVNGMSVDHGMVMDIGGGSLELTRFRDRRPERSWTLPLGGLRLSDRFLRSDPPTAKEREALSEYVAQTLREAEVPVLAEDERLVATGGTVRNLAKVDRHHRTYPIPRLHGYVLTRKRVEEMADTLASRRSSRRAQIPGLNADRTDSVVGGALASLGTMVHTDAPELWVSGQGLREGVAMDALGLRPPDVGSVRRASVRAMAERFVTWDPEHARRRARIALLLSATLDPDAGASWQERLEQAATLLDVGRSIDYYRRFEHTADVITHGDLAGFTHRKLAKLAAVVRFAGDDRVRIAQYRPLLTSDDRPALERSAAILELADEIEHRLSPGDPDRVLTEERGRAVLLTAPVFDPWLQRELADRFARAFRRKLQFREPADRPE
jgi:exopolyphosphatase/guanosine-5'-triphosphate,3'-diphosphate pyrophosphatase